MRVKCASKFACSQHIPRFLSLSHQTRLSPPRSSSVRHMTPPAYLPLQINPLLLRSPSGCGFLSRMRTSSSAAPQRHIPVGLLRMAGDDNANEDKDGRDTNTTDWTQGLGQELLRAKRPRGVDDVVEGIRQAPGTNTLFQNSDADDEPVYPGEEVGLPCECGAGAEKRRQD